jgi:serine/threonine protein kinase
MHVPDELIERLCARAEPLGVFADRFRIGRVAGIGATSAVYHADDELTGQVVALKILRVADVEGKQRFAAECDLLAQIDHPAVVRAIGRGHSRDGEPYLALEWIDGSSLSERLAEGGLDVDETIALGRRLAGALSALHDRRVIHRDIKPGNILLPGGRAAEAKLADLSLATVLAAGDGADRASSTQGAALVGTPGYMAPEQARASVCLDGRADLFALGCVLFVCLTQRGPFDGSCALTALAKVLLLDPPRVGELRPEVPPSLDDLIGRLLAKNRNDRPPSADAVRDELERMTGTVRAWTNRVAGGSRPAPPAGPGPVAGALFGRYLVERQLAVGGTGELFSTWDTVLRRPVALKVPRDREAGVARLYREGRIAASLRHPQVVAIFDVGEQDGVAFLAMEHISGQTLRAHASGVSRQRLLAHLLSVARTLHAVHESGLAHGDLKPENIMVSDDGEVKLFDFGVDLAAGGVGADNEVAPGTPAYIAPERLRGGAIDGRADQFAWGVMACELLAGSSPWSGSDPLSILASVLYEEPRLSGLPLAIAPVLRRTLHKDPEQRFASMAHVVKALTSRRHAIRPCKKVQPGANGPLPTSRMEAKAMRAHGEIANHYMPEDRSVPCKLKRPSPKRR